MHYMFTCTKIYPSIPFAHRQHLHKGHCAKIHGHSWSIKFIFACKELDSHGFVVDFGGLECIKTFFSDKLDHACVFNQSDELMHNLVLNFPDLIKPYIVDNCSCEGLAKHFYELFSPKIADLTNGRAYILAVEVQEDMNNSARYQVQ